MNKSKKIITIVIMSIASLMVVLSGIMKLSQNEQIVETMTKVGVIEYINLLGIMEIVFTALFLFPKTMKIGFILLTCYFAGAIATELSHDGPLLNPAMPLVLIWVAAFLRDQTIFLPKTSE